MIEILALLNYFLQPVHIENVSIFIVSEQVSS